MFPETEWTQIRDAVTSGGTVDPARIEAICDAYYEPISGFVAKITGGGDAEDIAQEFMADLARGRYLTSADPGSGKLRCFLCECARNHARSVWRARAAQKRGGAAEHVSIDETGEPEGVELDMAQFDREWAREVVERAREALREAKGSRMEPGRFDLLVEGFGWSPGGRSRTELAEAAGMTRIAFNTAVHRLRQNFIETLREEVRQTVSDAVELEDELRYYLALYAAGDGEGS